MTSVLSTVNPLYEEFQTMTRSIYTDMGRTYRDTDASATALVSEDGAQTASFDSSGNLNIASDDVSSVSINALDGTVVASLFKSTTAASALESDNANVATVGYVNSKVSAPVDLSGYEQRADLESDVTGILDSALPSKLAPYLTAEDASATYQVKGDYLTQANAAAAYQPKGSYANTSDIYTKSVADSTFETIANADTIRTNVAAKADADDVYTKEQADDMFVTKEDIHPPVTPTAIDYSNDIMPNVTLPVQDEIIGQGKSMLLEPSSDNYDDSHISIWTFNLKFGWTNHNANSVDIWGQLPFIRLIMYRRYNNGSIDKEDVIANCPLSFDEDDIIDGSGHSDGYNAYLNVLIKKAIPDTYDTSAFVLAAYSVYPMGGSVLRASSMTLLKSESSITRKVYLQSKSLLQKYASETYYTTSQADAKFNVKYDDAVRKIYKGVPANVSTILVGSTITTGTGSAWGGSNFGTFSGTDDIYVLDIQISVIMADGLDVNDLVLGFQIGDGSGVLKELTNNGNGKFSFVGSFDTSKGTNKATLLRWKTLVDGTAQTFTITSLSVYYLVETTIDEYPTKDEVSDAYLSKTEASSTYLDLSSAANYLLKSAIHDGGVGNTNIKIIPYTSGSGSSAVYRLLVKNSSNTIASINSTGLFATNGYVNTALGVRFGTTVDSSSGAPTDTSASNGKWATYLNNVITTTQYPNCSSISTFKSAYSAYSGSGYSFDNFVPSFQVIRDNYYDKSYIDALEARIAALENN